MSANSTSNNLHFISAGAGSGKTYRLTQILTEALTQDDAKPAGVIATTFTKKAATELRQRVRGHLLKEGRFSLANAMGQARIGTVNSVCGSFLTRFAFEAGLSTEQQVLEESQSKHLISKAIDEATQESQRAKINRLAIRLGIEDWAETLKSLVDQSRANNISPEQLLPMAEQNADDLLSHFSKAAKEDLSAALIKEANSTLQTLRPAIEASGKKNSNDFLKLVTDFLRDLQNGYAAWSQWVKVSKSAPEAKLKPLAEPITDIAARYDSHPALHQDIRDFIEQMFSLAAEALSHYANYKREMGVLDFADQESLLLDLLDNPTVAQALSEELDLLLVDEFQDTSPIQLALFLKLSKLAKQTYWVGDIKQAIYGFRGSDTQLMEAVINALPEMGGQKSILDASWRSRPPLVKLVNEVFNHAFRDSLSQAEIQLEPKRADALAQTSSNTAFARWSLAGSNISQKDQALAMGIKMLVKSQRLVVDKATGKTRTVEFADITVLSRANAGVQSIAAALRDAGIPVATSQAGLLATPEAQLALACLRRLNDSGDTIATAEIVSLADGETPESWVADRLNYLAKESERTLWKEKGENAHPLIALIAELRTSLPVLAPREALQTVITRCDLSRKILQWKQDPAVARQRLANIEALLDMADSYEDSCRNNQQAATISGLILWLKEQAIDEQDSLALPGLDAVRVMTHHAAKGLEWPVVILTDLHKENRDRLWSTTALAKKGIDAHNPLKDRFIHFWPWPFGKQSSGIAVADEIYTSPLGQQFIREAKEEAKRLLYVSMTRPRDLLIFALGAKDKSWEWLDTLETPWLVDSDPEATTLSLPSGETIGFEQWQLEADPEDDSALTAEHATPISWFRTPPHEAKQPLNYSASGAAPIPCNVTDLERIGTRINITNSPDMGILGTALHACIGASFTDRNTPLQTDEYAEILRGFDVLEHLKPEDAQRQTEVLHQWIKQRWPNGRALAEVPIETRLPNGQIMNGRIDLLVETEAGWVLIDHKSSQLGADRWETLAQQYSGQLAAYAESIARTTGKPVLESWLYLPVAAGAVQISPSLSASDKDPDTLRHNASQPR